MISRSLTSRLKAVSRLVVLAALLYGAHLGVSYVSSTLEFDIRPSNEDALHRAIMILAAIYIMALALPFVPGVEIGLGLIVMLGTPIVFLIYVCTITGLTIAYLIGRLIPPEALANLARDLHLTRTEALLRRFNAQKPGDRLSFLLSSAPNRVTRLLLRFRYLTLAAAINMPGNFLIGGGGGIAMMAGLSRLYRIPGFLLCIALAVSPVPILVLLFGPAVFGP